MTFLLSSVISLRRHFLIYSKEEGKNLITSLQYYLGCWSIVYPMMCLQICYQNKALEKKYSTFFFVEQRDKQSRQRDQISRSIKQEVESWDKWNSSHLERMLQICISLFDERFQIRTFNWLARLLRSRDSHWSKSIHPFTQQLHFLVETTLDRNRTQKS